MSGETRASRLITIKLPENMARMIDELVRMGRFSNRSEAIRYAISLMLCHELGGCRVEG